jgi:hypothetical protein
MREGAIGRVLVASVHQAITELLPARVVFYEHWLHAESLSGGSIGMAPMSAVLSFLRQEGDEAYGAVMRKAGEYAADWSIEGLPSVERTLIDSAPLWMRRFAIARVFTRLVRNTFDESRASVRVRRGLARITLRDSIFCTVREPVAHPLCQFYESAARQLFLHFNPEITVSLVSCRGTERGGTTCVLSVALAPPSVAETVEAA